MNSSTDCQFVAAIVIRCYLYKSLLPFQIVTAFTNRCCLYKPLLPLQIVSAFANRCCLDRLLLSLQIVAAFINWCCLYKPLLPLQLYNDGNYGKSILFESFCCHRNHLKWHCIVFAPHVVVCICNMRVIK